MLGNHWQCQFAGLQQFYLQFNLSYNTHGMVDCSICYWLCLPRSWLPSWALLLLTRHNRMSPHKSVKLVEL